MKIQKDRRTVLIIDDDVLFCEAVSDHLTQKGIEVVTAHTGAKGLLICSQRNIDVVLIDQRLPDIGGVDLCSSILSRNEGCKIILVTAYSNFDHAIQAIRSGAYDYLSKPFELEELEMALSRVFKTLDLERVERVHQYNRKIDKKNSVLVGEGNGLKEISRLVDLAAANDASVLITGETGTGKSLVAKSIFYRSQFKNSDFIAINCAALPANLIETELFGHEKGAFTGAVSKRKGIFEMASGGILFLDEIGALDLQLQSKLLCVLDDKKIRRLGGEIFNPVDVRIISATNVDIERSVKEGAFREDLYYRLCVLRLHIPPLREHPDDIPELCGFFIEKYNPGAELEITTAEMDVLKQYSWPGNVRELRNVLERSIILRKGNILQPTRFIGNGCNPLSGSVQDKKNVPQIASLREIERLHIQYALTEMSNCRTSTAKILGVSRSTLKRKIREYKIDCPAQNGPVA